ncbi:hypothetical protein B0H13DRAFT_1063693 [Mycena leptocephala]|nr:hypothetical protein B0H13DRAFT_1063693 [Mycena leptocephala]
MAATPILNPRRVKPTRMLPPNPAVAAARRVSSIKLLDGDAIPDRSGEDILLLDGRLAAVYSHHRDGRRATLLCISRLRSTFMDSHPPLWCPSSPAATEARLSSPRVVSFPSSAFASSPSLSFRQRPGYPASITFHIWNRLFMLFLRNGGDATLAIAGGG